MNLAMLKPTFGPLSLSYQKRDWWVPSHAAILIGSLVWSKVHSFCSTVTMELPCPFNNFYRPRRGKIIELVASVRPSVCLSVLTLEVPILNFRIRGFGCTAGNTTCAYAVDPVDRRFNLLRA